MLDFTSALYLGLAHPSHALGPFEQLTTGRPSALAETPGAPEVARDLASLIGCESACMATSTLHAMWDLFGVAARRGAAVLRDAGTYPIAAWGAGRASLLGATVTVFRHFDADDLAAAARRARAEGAWPLVVTDGYCVGCGRVAPLADLAGAARDAGGAVLVDDAQMLGLAGRCPGPASPLGEGGGGSVRYHGLSLQPEIIVLSTLAKAFGAPLSVVAGSRAWVRRVAREGETRVFTSPPSVAAVRAAERAVRENSRRGETLRARLIERVRLFRRAAREAGAPLSGGAFPVQQVLGVEGDGADALHRRLLRRGIRAVLTRSVCSPSARVTFVVTAHHDPDALARAARALGEELHAGGRRGARSSPLLS